jgi:HSP90 family molecular chaperone
VDKNDKSVKDLVLLLFEDCIVEERRLKDLVEKHSEFISYPILLWIVSLTVLSGLAVLGLGS